MFAVDDDELSDSATNPHPERQSQMARPPDGYTCVKTKVFDIVLHKLPSGKSPASALEELLNGFLGQYPYLRVVATHMNTIVAPAESNAMPSSEEASIMIFCTVFYTE